MPSPPCPPSPPRALRGRPALRRALTPAVVSLALAASACGGTSGSHPSPSPSSAGTGSPAATTAPAGGAPASPSGTAGGSRTPSRTPTRSTGSTGPAGPTDLRARLLGAAQVPGVGDTSTWVVAGTGPERPSTSFGTCQRFGIVSIGAERAVVRRFAPAPPVLRPARHDRAGELVATFPDALTARRAYAVLEAWQRTCAARLSSQGHTDGHVGGLQDLAAGDRAGWYLLTYGPVRDEPGARFLDAQGMVLRGSRVAMVSLVHAEHAGRHDGHGPGQLPMATALRRAAHRLGAGG